MNADPATVFSFIDPDPNGPRSKWDKAIKELQIVDKVDSVSYISKINPIFIPNIAQY